jgi:hypothetical protein
VDWHQHCATIRYHNRYQGDIADISSRPLDDLGSSEVDSDIEEEEQSDEEGTGQWLMHLKKVLITPLRLLPYPATPEPSCRILRQCVPLMYSTSAALELAGPVSSINAGGLHHTN